MVKNADLATPQTHAPFEEDNAASNLPPRPSKKAAAAAVAPAEERRLSYNRFLIGLLISRRKSVWTTPGGDDRQIRI